MTKVKSTSLPIHLRPSQLLNPREVLRTPQKPKSLAPTWSHREAVAMMLSVWVQYTWELKTLPTTGPVLNARYTAEAASPTPDDQSLLLACISRSISMEPSWSHDANPRNKLAEELIETAFPAGEISFVAVKHGARIIAAAALRDAGDKVSNLPLGICVLNEYRCRGIGTFLLHDSLRRLREKGLKSARLVTKKGLPADRFLYPKFGSVRAVLAGVPA